MDLNKKKLSIVTVEINILSPENILNILWRNNINVSKIKRENRATIILDIVEEDYNDLEKIVKRNDGKIKILKRKGKILVLYKIKKSISLIAGGIIFLLMLFILSTHIWSIEIYTEKNVSPFEIRKELSNIGIVQGLKKSEIDVYDIEKKLEDLSSEIVWVRARMEGSTLKIKIEEKVNPPKLLEGSTNSIVASMDGEIKRVYTKSGTALVKPGDMVKKGDELIAPYSGGEGMEYEVKPSGVVTANTFYEKEVEVQIKGEKLERTGECDRDIFLNINGKKIYLKKAINSFENYDKIEDNDGIIQGVTYLEKEKKKINLSKEDVVSESIIKLERLLQKELTNNAKIVSKEHYEEDEGNGKLKIVVQFVVEQDIAI